MGADLRTPHPCRHVQRLSRQGRLCRRMEDAGTGLIFLPATHLPASCSRKPGAWMRSPGIRHRRRQGVSTGLRRPRSHVTPCLRASLRQVHTAMTPPRAHHARAERSPAPRWGGRGGRGRSARPSCPPVLSRTIQLRSVSAPSPRMPRRPCSATLPCGASPPPSSEAPWLPICSSMPGDVNLLLLSHEIMRNRSAEGKNDSPIHSMSDEL